MNTLKKQQLKSLGYTVTTKFANNRMRDFITYPDGHTFAWFDHLTLIQPGDLADGEAFDLAYLAVPEEVAYAGIAIDVYEYPPPGGTWEYEYDEQGNLIIPWWYLVLLCACITVTVGVLLHMIASVFQKINAPCGINIQETPVNDCWSIFVAPDCSIREFNACDGPDDNGDGYPDGEWANGWHKEVFDPTEIIKWAVIGTIAIAGTFLVYSFLKPKPYYPPPPPPEAKNSYTYA